MVNIPAVLTHAKLEAVGNGLGWSRQRLTKTIPDISRLGPDNSCHGSYCFSQHFPECDDDTPYIGIVIIPTDDASVNV
jgi:hypothetical protein